MKPGFALVKNVQRFSAMADALINRPPLHPGIGVGWGPTGYGKSTVIAWWANEFDAVHTTLEELSTPSSLLDSLCKELGVRRRASLVATMALIIERLSQGDRPRPIVVDEADYLLGRKKMPLLNVLRGIHDKSQSPLILIGMHDFVSGLISQRDQAQFVGRIGEWLKFEPIDMDDLREIVRLRSEVEIAEDLMARLHQESGGSARRAVIAISQVEKFAKLHGHRRVSADMAKKLVLRLDARSDIAARLGIAAALENRGVVS